MEEFPSDSELLSRARTGDSSAFAQLCERHRSRVWRVAASVSPQNAEDLAQEAIVRAWTSLPRFRGDAPFAAWLSRIALNAAQDYRRSAWSRRIRAESVHTGPSTVCPAGEAEKREAARRVRASVAFLPERLRVPIWLHYFEQFSIAEIAALEKAPESTIRSRIKSGLARLQADLRDLIEDADEAHPMELNPERCR